MKPSEPRKRKITDPDDLLDMNENYEAPNRFAVSKKEAEDLMRKSLSHVNVNFGDGAEFDTFDPFNTGRESKSSKSSKASISSTEEYMFSVPYMPKTEYFCRRCQKFVNLA